MNGKLGNVHSGATPPWLRGDDDDKGTSPSSASSVTFGPSLDEFIKHSKLVHVVPTKGHNNLQTCVSLY